MREVLYSSSSSPSSLSCVPSSTPIHNETLFRTRSSVGDDEEEEEVKEDSGVTGGGEVKERDNDRDQLCLLALLVTIFRKSFGDACRTDRKELCGMEIGWPTNVRHVAHVTFDRFNGFLGLPVEFEPEVPRRAPSASATVFGVSTESMQLSYDLRGNSVPTILLLMQTRLYGQGGLQAEGIFRINAENSREEYVRDQLNRGVVPEGIDVHCLAGLIKTWFRELPTGLLDSLSSEGVMQCQSEEDCAALMRLLPPTEAALLDWAINLMADVVQQEHVNKMNARNIAMVFAPNMTKMADPLTALMYAVQVMNFLKALIVMTLQEREDSMVEPALVSCSEPSDENGHHSPSQPCLKDTDQENEEMEMEPGFIDEEPILESTSASNQLANPSDGEAHSDTASIDESYEDSETPTPVHTFPKETEARMFTDLRTGLQENSAHGKIGQSSVADLGKGAGIGQQPVRQVMGHLEKSKEISNLSRINSITDQRIEAWR